MLCILHKYSPPSNYQISKVQKIGLTSPVLSPPNKRSFIEQETQYIQLNIIPYI
jgi:hypothetical protein